MCYFVFLGVSAPHELTLIERLTKAGFEVHSTSNSSVRKAFPRTDTICVVTRGGCSCDIFGEPSAPRFDEEVELAKYRKKGWSPAKIERAIMGRRPRERSHFAAFRDTLIELVPSLGAVRLLAHVVSGSVETAEVIVRGHQQLLLEQYVERAGAYDERVLYELTKA
jgi:hypothetical protein